MTLDPNSFAAGLTLGLLVACTVAAWMIYDTWQSTKRIQSIADALAKTETKAKRIQSIASGRKS